jgi:hypothetical protein
LKIFLPRWTLQPTGSISLILRGRNGVGAECRRRSSICRASTHWTTQVAYDLVSWKRLRASYLDDVAYLALQNELMQNLHAGDVIEGTGGLRKLRQADPRRGKGKRGACG